MIVLAVFLWLGCGFIGAGWAFAYAENQFVVPGRDTRRESLGFSLVLALIGGPVFMVTAFLLSGFAEHGWRLR